MRHVNNGRAGKPILRKGVLVLCIAVAAGLAAASDRSADKSRLIKIESAYLRLIDQVDVPAQAAGVLEKIPVREGLLVKENDVLVELDDADAVLAHERARYDLDIARRVAANDAKVEEARTAVGEAQAASDKAGFELDIARRKAESDIGLRAAKKSQALAEAELQRAVAARKEFRDSVSQNELEHFQLAADKARLEVEQAEQDRQTADLTRQMKSSEVGGLELAVKRRQLDLKQAEEAHQIAAITERVRENDLAVAQRDLDRRRLRAPLSGMVVQILRRKGEWVEPGEKVVRILRLDRLRAEGFVAARDLPRDLTGADVAVTVSLPNKSRVEVRGKIVFVSPEIDPVNEQVLVWAEVDNPGPQFVLRPGMKASMTASAAAEK